MNYNPTIFNDLLEARSLSRADLAKRLEIDSATIDRELSVQEPKQAVLNSIAKELALPAFVFYMSQAPTVKDNLVDFRSVSPSQLAKSRYTIQSIQTAIALQKLLKDGAKPPKQGLPYISQPNLRAIEEVAFNTRSFFQISLEDQLEAKNAKSFYNVCRKRIEDKGIYVLQDSFPSADGSGFCLSDPEFPVIVVNTTNQVHGRRLFTLVHELAHVLLMKSGISDPFVSKNATEQFCNRFAACFLVPAKLVAALLKGIDLSVSPDLSAVTALARRLKISVEASVLRMEQLGRFKDGTYAKFKKFFESKNNPDTIKPKGGGSGPPPQEVVKLARYGFGVATAMSRLISEGRTDPIKIYRAIGLKPKFQPSYFSYVKSLSLDQIRNLELGDDQ